MSRIRSLSIILAWPLSVAAVSPVLAATITVNTTSDELNSDGDCSLREALLSAMSDTPHDACLAGSDQDTVFVPTGTYVLTLGPVDLSTALIVRGEDAAATIIDGDGSTRIFRRSGSLATVEISNLTIANCSAPSGMFGAALSQGAEYHTIFRHVTIDGCSSLQRGGAIYMGDGLVQLFDCHLIYNHSFEYGGAVYMGGGRLEAVRTIFEANWAEGNSPGDGGAISNHSPSGSIELENCTFRSNSARYGGAISSLGEVVVSGCLFQANSARSQGGALLAQGSIVNSTFSGNWAGTTDPSTAGSGGAIRTDGEIRIFNSTFVDNSIYRFGTFEGNSLTVGASGASIANSMLDIASGANCNAPLASGGYNLTSDTSCGLNGPGDLMGVDPLVYGLADNGGPTLTHGLQPGSPAIEAGNPLGCTWDHDDDAGTAETPVRIDQREHLRTWDGNTDGVPVCDAGAYEYGAPDGFLFRDGFESGDTNGWTA